MKNQTEEQSEKIEGVSNAQTPASGHPRRGQPVEQASVNDGLPQRGKPATEPTAPPRRPARASGGVEAPPPIPANLLTLDECEALLRALSHGQGPFTQKEAETLWEWARSQRLGNTFVDLLLEGFLKAKINVDGEVMVTAVPLDEAVNHLAEIQGRHSKK